MTTSPTRDIVSLHYAAIRTDGGTQSRADLDFEVVDEYTQAMQDGVKFPPLTVCYDGKQHWLIDGFHRLTAGRSAKIEQFDCEVIQGTVSDARWLSCAVNATHGLKRTNADKRRAVGIYVDNGEEVLVDLPEHQELIDQLYELSRDADAEIARWKSRYRDVCQFSFLSVCANVLLLALLVWGWTR